MPSLSAILIIAGLVGTIGSGAGAWLYRGQIDAGEKQAALDARALEEQGAISKAYAKGQTDTQELADAQAQRAKQSEQDLAKEKADHANDIRNSHAALVLAAGKCAVRRSDVRVLDTPGAVPGPAPAPAATAAGQQRDDTGTVGAVAVIETCERNKYHFDADLAKLQQCVAAYNDARTKLNGPRR